VLVALEQREGMVVKAGGKRRRGSAAADADAARVVELPPRAT
jgi:hypothetical protein